MEAHHRTPNGMVRESMLTNVAMMQQLFGYREKLQRLQEYYGDKIIQKLKEHREFCSDSRCADSLRDAVHHLFDVSPVSKCGASR